MTESKESAERTLRLVKEHVDVLGVKEEQVVGAVEYEFLGKSAIVQLAPEVDLEGLKYDPKDMVSRAFRLVGSIHSRCRSTEAWTDGRTNSQRE